jgi:hypothetical protein
MNEAKRLRDELFKELRARELVFDGWDPNDTSGRADILLFIRRVEARLTELNGAEFLHHADPVYRAWVQQQDAIEAEHARRNKEQSYARTGIVPHDD